MEDRVSEIRSDFIIAAIFAWILSWTVLSVLYFLDMVI